MSDCQAGCPESAPVLESWEARRETASDGGETEGDTANTQVNIIAQHSLG